MIWRYGEKMSEKLSPVLDRILIRQAKGENVTAGGILIPEPAREKPLKGEVLAVGGGRVTTEGILIKPNVKPGDVVLFNRFAGTEVRFNGEDLLVLKEEDILCVFE